MADDERRAEIESVARAIYPQYLNPDEWHLAHATEVIAALDRVRRAPGDERGAEIEAWRMEVCPVCGKGPNITGAKYCYGRPLQKHDKARWEWVEVVRRAPGPSPHPLAGAVTEAVFTYLNDCIVEHREPWDEGGLYNAVEAGIARAPRPFEPERRTRNGERWLD